MPRKKKVTEVAQFDVQMNTAKAVNAPKVTKTVNASSEQDALRKATQGDPQTSQYDKVTLVKKAPGKTTGATPSGVVGNPSLAPMQNQQLGQVAEALLYPYAIMVPNTMAKMFTEMKDIASFRSNYGNLYVKVTTVENMKKVMQIMSERNTELDQVVLKGIKESING